MNIVYKKYFKQIGIVVLFLLVSVLSFYFIYWADLSLASDYTVAPKDTTVELTFEGETKRFLTVYFAQEFVDAQTKINFVGLEALRFSDMYLRTEAENNLRIELLDLLENIIIKSNRNDFDFSLEDQKLKKLLEDLP
jgi:hypothetical protein